MSATIINGKAIAAELRARVAAQVPAFRDATGRAPGLAVVLVGEDAASAVYVRNKGRATREAGMESIEHRLPDTTTTAELLDLVGRLNADPAVDGILVQLPLPAAVDTQAVIEAIDPDKDVDGFHPVNAGRLATGLDGLVPCTPLGCILLLRTIHPHLAGLEAVVVGRSNIVGKPMAQLLLRESCTVTVVHSRTRDAFAHIRQADIVVAAVGIPGFVPAAAIKPGATVIDVGINRTDTGLVGDVDFAAASEVAGAITPVPGGVGPMTIACLLRNTLVAAARREGVSLDLATIDGAAA
ncbi:bifunctional methylenetetrahydrofolate dehydrogenase/methenyltetrahydrofolate cyclohydrolase FolD [Sphingomonas aerophila]|uniref:Bifunctional protein FolD n=1 Tax=Sphingomonas aerophila TaxID=1344948 RepID=A0A7W9BDG1_9SPHN|nr:bifunctional methylenetetrahydrofolate dehydrogenase/methenyltetrahydrofolate cyclohydrolase FolD [Sphingomonas aerophila]MBB5715158.1 methylenetetrahydrofolate dehydrogenase (NADP+)/methenyltetrahydrofolate cyclohydrolase [Sphingomonas aerophila]